MARDLKPNFERATKEWWGKNVQDYPVWRTEDLPESWFKGILMGLQLAQEIRQDTIVLCKPDTDPSVLIRTYFQEILSCVLKSYFPYAVTGIAAYLFYLGDNSIPKEVKVLNRNSNTRIELGGISRIIIERKKEFFEDEDIEKCTRTFQVGHYSITIETPESLLVHLRLQSLRDYPQVISAFLKAVPFNLDVLRSLLLKESRPIINTRFAVLLEQVGKTSEAQMIRDLTKVTTHYALPGIKQIIKHPLPSSIALKPLLSDPAYVIRFRDQFRYYRDQLEAEFSSIETPQWNLTQLLSFAEKTKKQDTYHSSTIEGYRVSQEEIQALIDGRPSVLSGASREEVEIKMALKGCLEAHKFVLQTLSIHFKKHTPLTELIIQEIFAHLFSPTVEAGLLSKEQLTQYRDHSGFIRASRHIPPNYQKVDHLMRCLVEEINAIQEPKTKAILAHYGFVTIHPFFDGNGRVARFLMNYLLSLGGIPWITIRIEDRENYFRALESAQCDENIKPFAELCKRYLAASSLSAPPEAARG